MKSYPQRSSVRCGTLAALCVATALLGACSKPGDNTPPGSGGTGAPANASSASNRDPKPVAPPFINDMSPKICKVLNDLAPQAQKLAAIGTQVQLVLALAEAFNMEATSLQRVKAEIDTLAIASCPTARDSLLIVLKMQSLQEAVR